MTKYLAIALVASLGFVGAASAQNSMLAALAQAAFDTLNMDVDASTLDREQLAQVVTAVINDGIDDDDAGQIQQNNNRLIRRLEGIVE